MKRIVFMILMFTATCKVSSAQDNTQKPFSNATFMYGTDLGKYMQTLLKLGRIDDMVKFTASETIRQYGESKVRDYYENCGFAYQIKAVSSNPDGKYRIITYKATIYATARIVRLKTVVENDTAKVVLKNLKIEYGE